MADQPWWHTNYPYRRQLSIVPDEDIEAGYIVRFDLPVAITIESGKVIPLDQEDLEIVYYDPDPVVLGRSVEVIDDQILVAFSVGTDVAEDTVNLDHFAYYGNPDLIDAPSRPVFVDDLWPSDVTIDDGISFTRPGEFWIDGVSEVMNAKATFTFGGTAVRISAIKGPNAGIAEVQIDDGAWEDVDLYQVTTSAPTVVYEVTDLVDVAHTIRYRVSGRKDSRSTSTAVNLTMIEYAKRVPIEELGEEILELTWSTHSGGA